MEDKKGSKIFQKFPIFLFEKLLSLITNSVSPYEPNTFLPGTSRQEKGGVGSHTLTYQARSESQVSPVPPTGSPSLEAERSLSHASFLRQGLSEGPPPGGGKEKERVERNQRNRRP